MSAKQVPASKINRIFTSIKVEHVMAFNNISAPAYLGRAVAIELDGSLDDEPDLGVIIVANDDATLARFYERIGQRLCPEKVKPVGVVYAAHIKVIPYTRASAELMSRTYADPMQHKDSSKDDDL